MQSKAKGYESTKEYRKSKIKRIPLDIPVALYEEFKSMADASGEKVNTILRSAIENYIAEHKSETQPCLTSLSAALNKQKPSKLVESLTEAPDQSSNLKWWERSIPSKYRGQFATYSEFTDYIRANDLLSELETDLDP